MKITFRGTRGSIPVPDARVMRYGGNTTCVAVETGGELLIIDAGTGIRRLGEELAAQRPEQITLLVTHTHWDHIHGFPFFAPAFQPGAKVDIRGCSTCLPSLRAMFDRQMALEYFPVTFTQLRATVTFTEIPPAGIDFGGGRLRLHRVNHPAPTVGVRLDKGDGSLVFITDSELFAEPAAVPYAAIVEFCRGAKLLVHDAQYTDAEYAQRRGWGHSTYEQAIRLAADAGAGQLVCFHHDPNRLDDELAGLEQKYQQQSSCPLTMAREGETLAVTN
jgi:phosphoribosyl 1,2-cyclic phosphodiesterase